MDRPIGMFDSGFGGLTVARAVIDLLPAEDLVYIGDTGRYPYGPKPLDEVRGFARELAWSLVEEHGAKGRDRGLQHGAAAAARRAGRRAAGAGGRRDRPRAPGPSSRPPRSGRVGVIGTVGTIGSGAYDRAVARTG
jgi:glutamate racemase